MRHDSGIPWALATAGLLAGLAAMGRRGSRSSQLDTVLELVPELRMRWDNDENDEGWEHPDEVEGFHLSDMTLEMPPPVRRWWEKATGTTYLGHGNYRVAVRMSDGSVVKFAMDHTGEEGIEREIDAWNESANDPEVRELFVPMISGRYDYVQLEHATPLTRAMLAKDPKLKAQFQARQARANALHWEGRHRSGDIDSIDNWGIHNGVVKMLDYEAIE